MLVVKHEIFSLVLELQVSNWQRWWLPDVLAVPGSMYLLGQGDKEELLHPELCFGSSQHSLWVPAAVPGGKEMWSDHG